MTNESVVKGDDQGDTTEAVAKAAIPNSRCSNVSAIEDSGRIMFRGVDMLYVTINGIQMFTFYEIIGKISPHAKRGNTFFLRSKCIRNAMLLLCSRWGTVGGL